MLHEHNKQSKTDHLIHPQKFELFNDDTEIKKQLIILFGKESQEIHFSKRAILKRKSTLFKSAFFKFNFLILLLSLPFN
jgi:hypothetical protein